MKKTLAILFLLILTSVNYISAQYYTVKTNSTLNVRSGPGKEYSKIGTLANGKEIYVDGFENGWAKFDYNGSQAYVSKSFLEVSNSVTESDTNYSYSGGFWGNIFHTLDGWGFWGGLLLYLVIPFVLTFICIKIPVMLISRIKLLNNCLFLIITSILALVVLFKMGDWLSSHNAYSGLWAVWIYVYMFFLACAFVFKTEQKRCPQCHSMKTDEIDSTDPTESSSTRVRTGYNAYGDVVSRESTTTITRRWNVLSECNECGHRWWRSEKRTFER
ncbi:MAG: SH3 domain-containing protein [Dysgonomonas sp.]|nr:SH3 domain-containing protein [Dysgonomonas sp.]